MSIEKKIINASWKVLINFKWKLNQSILVKKDNLCWYLNNFYIWS